MAILWRFDADGLTNASLTTSMQGSADSGPVTGITKSGTAVVSVNDVVTTGRGAGEHLYFSQKLTNQTCRVEKSLGATRASYGFRFYIRWAGTPTAVTSFVGGYLSGTEVWHLRRNTSNRLTIQTGATTISNAPTTATAANTWYRVEGTCSANDILVVNVYTGDGTTPLLTLTGTSSGMQIDELRFGAVTSIANVHPDMRMDEFFVQDVATEPGPWFAAPSVNDGATTTAPSVTLDVGASVAPTDASVTTTAPSAGFTPEAVTTYNKVEDVSYHDGVGDSTRRVLDIYIPNGTAPAGGWPIVMFAHGGGFNSGSEDDLSGAAGARIVRDSIAKGFALVSVRYKRTNFVLDNNLGWTRPHAVQDILCATKWLSTQTTYDLNADFIVGLGYSAGGHLIMESALLAEDSTPDSYSAVYRGQAPGATPGTTGPYGTRYTAYPTLDHTEGRTGIPTFKGVFSMGGPWDLPQVFTDNTLIIGILGLYYGARPSTGSLASLVGEEGDLGAFIEGRTGSIYDARTATPPSFPIGITYSTGDTTVPTSTSYTPMRAALDTVGYDVSQDSNGNVATGVALSRHGYAGTGGAGGHDTIPTQYDSTFYSGWLDEVIALQSGSDNGATTSAPVTDFFVPTGSVSIDAPTDTSAPSASVSVPTPLVTVDADVSTTAPSVDATVPTPSASGSSAGTADPVAIVTVITVPDPTVTITRDDSATSTAPSALAAVGTVVVDVLTDVLTTAASLALSVPTPSVSGATSDAVTTTAPETVAAVGSPIIDTASPGSADPTATEVVLGLGTVGVDVSSGATVTTTAPAVTVLAPVPTTTSSASVTTAAPGVSVATGSATPGTGAIYVIASRLLPPSMAAILRPSGWTARLKG